MNGNSSRSRRFRIKLLWCVVAAIAVTGPAAAVEIESQLSAGIGYSDNVGRGSSSVETVSETIRTLGFDFALMQETGRLNADIRSTFNYLNYVDDSFESEIIGGAVIAADYAIAEERLLWLFQYNWGQQLRDLFEVSRPDNREDVFALLTGPRLIIPMGARMALTTDLQYSNTDYEIQPQDFESGAVIISLGRQVRDNTNISLNGSARRFEFADELFPSYDQNAAFLRFESQSERNALTVDVGYTEVDADGEKGDGVLFRADWTRTISGLTTLQLSAGSQYSDNGDIFRFFQQVTQDLDMTNSVNPFGSPFRNNFANAILQYKSERTAFDVSAVITREDYELVATNNLDRNYYGFEIELTRELSRKFFTQVGVWYRSIDYEFQSRSDQDFSLSLDLGFRFSPALNIALQYQYLDRNSTDLTSESTENRTMLRFGYVPRWGR